MFSMFGESENICLSKTDIKGAAKEKIEGKIFKEVSQLRNLFLTR